MSGTELLLDTNVVIGILKRSEAVRELAKTFGFADARISLSQITRIELLSSAKLSDADVSGIEKLLAD